MAEGVVVGQLGLTVARAPQRVMLALGPLGIALTAEEARQVAALLASTATQVEADIVLATPDQLPPLQLNGRG